MSSRPTSDGPKEALAIKKFQRINRTRQLAILQANAVRGAIDGKTNLPLDPELPPGAEVIAAAQVNQVLMAPDGWGKTALTAQIQEACDRNGWAQALVVRCSTVSVRSASFRQAIREILVALAQALETGDQKNLGAIATDLGTFREAVRELHGRADVISKAVTTRRLGTTSQASSETTEESTTSSSQRQKQRTIESATSMTQAVAALAVGPFFAVARTAMAVVSSRRTTATATLERRDATKRHAFVSSREASETMGRSETFQQVDDLKDRLDLLREDLRQLILRRQEILKRPTTYLIIDDFDEIPLASQPHVAEFLRLLAASVCGFVKILGRPHHLNLYLDDDIESAGFRPERDIMTIPTSDRFEEFEAWESWLRQRLSHFHQMASFEGGSKSAGHPRVSDTVLAHMALICGGRPGVFYRLYARANDLAWRAHDSGQSKELAITDANVDGAMWELQQVQARSLADATVREPQLARLVHYLKLGGDARKIFFEFEQRELAWNSSLRLALERLIDQLVMFPVGGRVDRGGREFQIYLCDPRIFATAEEDRPVDWSAVRDAVVGQRWNATSAGAPMLPVTIQLLTHGPFPSRPKEPARISASPLNHDEPSGSQS